MTNGQIRWNQTTADREGATTSLTLTCAPDGAIHMETPQSQGGFVADFDSPEQAMQGLAELLQQGIQQASEFSSAS